MFIKLFLISFVIFAAGTVARAQLRAEPSGVDLGKQKQNLVVESTVKLINGGTTPVEISGVTADCGCTGAQPEKTSLAPGESTLLKITMQTRSYEGAIHRMLRVKTGDEVLMIPIQLTVQRFQSWDVDSFPIDLVTSEKGQPAEKEFTLLYTAGEKAQLGEIVCTPDLLKAEIINDDGKSFRIKLTKRLDAPAGNDTVSVVVPTSDKAEPTITLYVFTPITSDLRVDPNPIILPSVKVGQLTRRKITLHNWAEPGEPRIELSYGEAKALGRKGKDLRYEISMTPTTPGPFTQQLRVYNGDNLEIEIPILLRADPADSAK